jgi:hypothetical protein
MDFSTDIRTPEENAKMSETHDSINESSDDTHDYFEDETEYPVISAPMPRKKKLPRLDRKTIPRFVINLADSDDDGYESEQWEGTLGDRMKVKLRSPTPSPNLAPLMDAHRNALQWSDKAKGKRTEQEAENEVRATRQSILDYLFSNPVSVDDVEVLVKDFNVRPYTIIDRMAVNIGLFWMRGRISDAQLVEMRENIYVHANFNRQTGQHRVDEKVVTQIERFRKQKQENAARYNRRKNFQKGESCPRYNTRGQASRASTPSKQDSAVAVSADECSPVDSRRCGSIAVSLPPALAEGKRAKSARVCHGKHQRHECAAPDSATKGMAELVLLPKERPVVKMPPIAEGDTQSTGQRRKPLIPPGQKVVPALPDPEKLFGPRSTWPATWKTHARTAAPPKKEQPFSGPKGPEPQDPASRRQRAAEQNAASDHPLPDAMVFGFLGLYPLGWFDAG